MLGYEICVIVNSKSWQFCIDKINKIKKSKHLPNNVSGFIFSSIWLCTDLSAAAATVSEEQS